jgi:threonine dehydrogenase-like Zn-dependent dehydrogenase
MTGGARAPCPAVPAGPIARGGDPLPADLDGHDPALVRDLALACRAVRRGRADRGDRVRVFGAGRLAALIGRVAALEGAAVLDRGAAELVFAVGGGPGDLAPALRAAVAGGRVVLLPRGAPRPPLDLAALAGGEIDLVGCGPPRAGDFETALALLAFQDVATE